MDIRQLIVAAVVISPALAEEPQRESETAQIEAVAPPSTPQAAKVATGPKTMSGMSILGNEEAPKALVIVPWKSSELGDDISLTESLDDRARPVDRDVFARELHYFDIRTGR